MVGGRREGCSGRREEGGCSGRREEVGGVLIR